MDVEGETCNLALPRVSGHIFSLLNVCSLCCGGKFGTCQSIKVVWRWEAIFSLH
jgi:hypothetical protein